MGLSRRMVFVLGWCVFLEVVFVMVMWVSLVLCLRWRLFMIFFLGGVFSLFSCGVGFVLVLICFCLLFLWCCLLVVLLILVVGWVFCCFCLWSGMCG